MFRASETETDNCILVFGTIRDLTRPQCICFVAMSEGSLIAAITGVWRWSALAVERSVNSPSPTPHHSGRPAFVRAHIPSCVTAGAQSAPRCGPWRSCLCPCSCSWRPRVRRCSASASPCPAASVWATTSPPCPTPWATRTRCRRREG